MPLPAEIISLFEAFRLAFTKPTYQKVIILTIGTLLTRGNRTVTAALRVLGLEQKGDWSKYHHVLNRTKSDGLLLAHILLELIVKTFVATNTIIYTTVNETLERRWGLQIRKCGHWRDSLASSRKTSVHTKSIRWLTFAVVVQLPWISHGCDLPFLSVPLTTPKVSAALGIHLIGDGAYAVLELGLRAQANGITLIAPLRLDARLFDEPASRYTADGTKGQGRPATVGKRLQNLTDVATVSNGGIRALSAF